MSRVLLLFAVGAIVFAVTAATLTVVHGCQVEPGRHRSERELAFEQLVSDAGHLQAEVFAGKRLEAPLDYWGRSCHVLIRVNEHNARVLELSSAGADGEWGTADDLRVVLALPVPRQAPR